MGHRVAPYLDNPPLRYRRILLLAVAAVLALGRNAWVTPAYLAGVLGFVFLGAWALSRFCMVHGYGALYGLAVLLVPAVAVSIDRMTTDVALAALCVLFCWAVSIRNDPALYASLVLAPLARETGFALTAGYLAFTILRRDARAAVYAAVSAVPALAWDAFVRHRLPPDHTAWLSLIPFRGVLERVFQPAVYPVGTFWLKIAASSDYLGIIGIMLAFVLTGLLLTRERHVFVLCAAAFTAGVAFVGKADVWEQAYSFSRTMSPLFLLLALRGVETRRWVLLAPILMNLPRIALQYEAEIRMILRRL
jgi:hypothetical protein